MKDELAVDWRFIYGQNVSKEIVEGEGSRTWEVAVEGICNLYSAVLVVRNAKQLRLFGLHRCFDV